MRRMRTIAGRFLGVLLGAALALSPVAAIEAMAVPAESPSHHAVVPDTPPCDMPCEGCADQSQSPACMSACMGLIASIPLFDSVFCPSAFSHRPTMEVQRALVGTLHEPDTPPPKFVLA